MRTGLLFSGGLDSTAVLFWKKPDIAILINYGQVCFRGEYRASRQICKLLKIPLKVLNIDCKDLGMGKLFSKKTIKLAPTEEWLPFRNQLLITFGSIFSIKNDMKKLLIGLVKSDSIYKDGDKQFIKRINNLIINQEGGVKVEAPAIDFRTEDLIKKSKVTLDLLLWSHSCNSFEYSCGRCDSCKKNIEIFSKLYNLN